MAQTTKQELINENEALSAQIKAMTDEINSLRTHLINRKNTDDTTIEAQDVLNRLNDVTNAGWDAHFNPSLVEA